MKNTKRVFELFAVSLSRLIAKSGKENLAAGRKLERISRDPHGRGISKRKLRPEEKAASAKEYFEHQREYLSSKSPGYRMRLLRSSTT